MYNVEKEEKPMNAGFIKHLNCPSKQEMDQAIDFATKCDKFAAYGQRNGQTKQDVRILQHACAKLAETSCVKAIKLHEYQVKKDVDWEIYNDKQRDFSSDLVFTRGLKQFKIGVKLSMGKRNGLLEYLDGRKAQIEKRQHSYVFESIDPIKTSDIFIFCNMENFNWNLNNEIQINVYAWMRANVVESLFAYPFIDKLKATKRCVMQETCKNFSETDSMPCGLDEYIKRNL